MERIYGYCVEQASPEFKGYYTGRVSRIVGSKHEAEQIFKQWSEYKSNVTVFRILELRAAALASPSTKEGE